MFIKPCFFDVETWRNENNKYGISI